MHKKLSLLALALLVCGGAGPPAPQRVIRFGLTGDYAPYVAQAADGTFSGPDVDLARQIAREMGARAEFVQTTWTGLTTDFAAKRFDVGIGGLTVQPDRAAIGTFSVTLLDDGKRPLALCKNRARYGSIAAIDQPGTQVQINRGSAIAVYAKQWFHHATVTMNPDDATLVERVLQGQADVWITDGLVVDHMVHRYRGRLCATTTQPFTHQTKAWLIQNDPALIAGINRGLTRALRNGRWLRALRAVP